MLDDILNGGLDVFPSAPRTLCICRVLDTKKEKKKNETQVGQID